MGYLFEKRWRLARWPQTYRALISLSYKARYSFTLSAPSESPTAGFCERCSTGPLATSLNTGHFGSPRPLGSPAFAKLTQYECVIWATFASVAEATASSGELLSGNKRNVPRLLNT